MKQQQLLQQQNPNTTKQTAQQEIKQEKNLNRYFIKEDVGVTNKHIKRFNIANHQGNPS